MLLIIAGILILSLSVSLAICYSPEPPKRKSWFKHNPNHIKMFYNYKFKHHARTK